MIANGLISFNNVSTKTSVQDMIINIGKRLDFVKSSYKVFSGIFVENITAKRYRLYIHSDDERFIQQLKSKTTAIGNNIYNWAKGSSELLFTCPPENQNSYDMAPIGPDNPLKEKIIKFPLGSDRNMMDVILFLDTRAHPVHYIIIDNGYCHIAFASGTDAALFTDKLRKEHVESEFATSFATVSKPVEPPAAPQDGGNPDVDMQPRSNSIPEMDLPNHHNLRYNHRFSNRRGNRRINRRGVNSRFAPQPNPRPNQGYSQSNSAHFSYNHSRRAHRQAQRGGRRYNNRNGHNRAGYDVLFVPRP